MYLGILGKPTDQDLAQHPHVLLTSAHKGNPSVLDYAHPNTHGYPSWAPGPQVRDQHDPRIDECVIPILLIILPVSHKGIRRSLGWLLLPLSSCLVPT